MSLADLTISHKTLHLQSKLLQNFGVICEVVGSTTSVDPNLMNS